MALLKAGTAGVSIMILCSNVRASRAAPMLPRGQAASLAVKQHYEQRGQLTTERAVFDDNGDGVGREAAAPGPDGALARVLYLDAESPAIANNPELAGLVRRQRELEADAEALKLKKGTMPQPQWEAEYEKLMLELAKVSREIKSKSGS